MDMHSKTAAAVPFPSADPGAPRGCDGCPVRDRAICAPLGAQDLSELNRLGRRVTLQPGQTVMWEGDDSNVVANVIEGSLKLSICSGDGREQIVGVVYPSDFIGRPFGHRTPHSVTALTTARLCLFPRSSFDGFAHDHPAMEHRLLERTLDDLDRTRSWMLLLGRKSATAKVATFLMNLAPPQEQEGGDRTIDLVLSRQQIADVLALTIETVSRQMTDFKRRGIIDLIGRRGVEILDRQRLKELAESD